MMCLYIHTHLDAGKQDVGQDSDKPLLVLKLRVFCGEVQSVDEWDVRHKRRHISVRNLKNDDTSNIFPARRKPKTQF